MKRNPERLVVIAQIRPVSVGINEFVSSSHVLFLSLSQQREETEQARDRLHRIGQTKPVTAYFLLAANTVDEIIYKSHKERHDLENSVLEHVRMISGYGPAGDEGMGDDIEDE